MEDLGVEPEKIRDIPNGVDLARFGKAVDFDLRSALGLPAEARVILSVGREHPAKAYDVGLRAFARVAAQETEAYYVIVGRNTHRWQGLVDELGIGSRVVLWPGLFGDELVGAYRQADVFFSPSKTELMPLVVLEAMAAGLPAVVTNVSGSRDLIEDGHNGFVVEPGRPEEMARGLAHLVGDASLRGRLAGATLARVQAYSWDRISRMYLEQGCSPDAAANAERGTSA